MDDQSKFIDSEDMVTCPYNPAHILTRKRLAIHLLKCKKQHVEVSKEMKKCPHNIQHVIPQEEFQYHLQICPDRDNEYLNNYSIGQEPNDSLPDLMKNMTIPADVPVEENWDEEPNVSVLDKIQVRAENTVAFQSFSNLPPAQRKQLRMESRRKTRETLNKDEQEFERKKSEFMEKSSSNRYDDDKSSVVSAVSTKSYASSSASDVSYKTALTYSAMRLQTFEEAEETKTFGRGRGRSARLLSATPIVKFGIGRSKLFK